MNKLAVVFGTRPEAIKLGPVVAELRSLGIQPDIVATGQHWDLLRGTPAEGDLAGAVSLGLQSDGVVTRWLTSATIILTKAWQIQRPQVLVVQGDTMSVHAAAQAAHSLGIPVAHVEAGLRSFGLAAPWPEEVTRVTLGQWASWHYAPTEAARRNLLAERVPADTVIVTGNTVVSALGRYAPDVRPVTEPEPVVVVTMHRREIQTATLAGSVWNQVYQLAMRRPGWRIFWSVHPGFAKFLSASLTSLPPNVMLSAPMPYASFARVVARATMVVTDSGGLVEEAATLGVPTVIWRTVNDRPEAVEAGIAVMADPAKLELEAAVEAALKLPRQPSAAFGEPGAARLVATHLAGLL